MVIAIDLRPLLGGNKSGVEIVTEQLVTHLIRQGKEHTFILFINAWHDSSDLLQQWQGSNIIHVITRIPNKLLNIALIFLRRPYLDALITQKTGLQPDIYFLPDLRPASIKKAKKILLVHDLAFHHFPQFFSVKTRLWYKFINPLRAIKSCTMLGVVSEHTRQDLIKTYGCKPKDIEVIPNAIDEKFGNNISDSDIENVKKYYKLPQKFFLFLGTLEPRKNLATLINAFEKFQQNTSEKDIYLVIAGKKRPDIFKELHIDKDISDQSKSHSIFTGVIDEKHKAALYKAAIALVYPSLWEGFGLPVLEAMKCGTPVITSKISGLIETGGSAVLYIDPNDPETITEALGKILDPATVKELKAKMPNQLSKFSWEESAKKLLKVFMT